MTSLHKSNKQKKKKKKMEKKKYQKEKKLPKFAESSNLAFLMKKWHFWV